MSCHAGPENHCPPANHDILIASGAKYVAPGSPRQTLGGKTGSGFVTDWKSATGTTGFRQARVMKGVVIILAIQVMTYQQARCQGGGGPSTFGYDASSACSKPYSRSGRARLPNLPCDFRRQNWCTVAGNSYPWHAVRRFVQENQGLMRRMYGDERHINVLRAEFEKNDVELKYDEYYHHYTDDRRRYEYPDDYDYLDEYHEYSKLNNHEHNARGFTSRSFNDPTTKRLNKFVKLSEYTRPHFRPTEKSTSTTNTITTPVTSMGTTTSTSTSTKTVPSVTTPSPTPTTTGPTTSNTPSTTRSTNTTEQQPRNKTEEATTEPIVAISQIVKEQNFSINEIPGQIDRIDDDLEVIEIAEENTEELVVDETTVSSTSTTQVNLDEDEESSWPKDTTVQESFSSTEKQQQFRPRPENKVPGKPEASTMGGQLYQDVAAKEQQEQPVLKLRGVNACPVKEEVVAPFWANNTRGEVLALLNLYPFEQYVHWEKCTHENKQMYCKDGCRCEQQYRLHRLLAYDPNNECRGIFSDWFKFPSCCVCRCYDLPLEFRVTSRSPRAQKQRIKVRPPRSRFS